ncbi:1765_t:CDS:2 [Dentiscutata erythropus]|uniref:1765_t:CDS:1 n=1 Tax=Dentiscutata erythropus TaxID=1348616 RepID=A0A9N9FV34_9GLOM|nr:1765_t:CDS:2 [Dentiscutata erythropus]
MQKNIFSADISIDTNSDSSASNMPDIQQIPSQKKIENQKKGGNRKKQGNRKKGGCPKDIVWEYFAKGVAADKYGHYVQLANIVEKTGQEENRKSSCITL